MPNLIARGLRCAWRVAGEHDLGQAVLGDAVVVHEPLRLHRADLRGRLDAIGHRERARAARPTGATRLAVAAELALRQRPEGDDALCVARGDRRVREGDRGAGAVASASERLRREREVAHPERRAQPDGFVALHVRHDAIDVTHRQPRVVDRVPDRDARELELTLGRLAALVVARLADPDDDRSAAH